MAYELVIRTREAATEEQRGALHAALQRLRTAGVRAWLEGAGTEAPVEPLESGATLAIANGGAVLDARVVALESGVAGVDLVIKSGGTEEELRDALQLAVRLAGLPGLLLYDPQLAREVAGSDVESVVESWKRMQSWTLELTGLAEDPRGMPLATSAETPTGGRKLLVIGGIIVLLYVLLRAVGSGSVELEEPEGTPVQRIPPNLVPPPPQLQPPAGP